MEVISVNDLTKDYGLGRGVFNVNLSIQKGEVYGFLGPNGAWGWQEYYNKASDGIFKTRFGRN